MHLQATLLFSLLTSAFALPTTTAATKPAKRAILSPQQYSQFQVSNGVGGNALAEVKAKFPVRSLTPQESQATCPNDPHRLTSLASLISTLSTSRSSKQPARPQRRPRRVRVGSTKPLRLPAARTRQRARSCRLERSRIRSSSCNCRC